MNANTFRFILRVIIIGTVLIIALLSVIFIALISLKS